MKTASLITCKNWPDLRRDCDRDTKSLEYPEENEVRIDLIYEGIATKRIILFIWKFIGVRIDLIYEGIATVDIFNACAAHYASVRIDLIYEGIATLFPFFKFCLFLAVRIDLIYEGIATNFPWLTFQWGLGG